MLDTNNVDVAITGAVYRASRDATVPTSPTEVLDEEFFEFGWIGESGIVEDPKDETTEKKAWQHGTIVRRLITGNSHTFKFTVWETNALSLETYHKGSTIETAGGVSTLRVKAPTTQRWMFVFDVIDGDKHMRIVVEDGEVTERGQIVYKNDEIIAYEMTITAYPLEDVDGDTYTAIKLSDDAAWDNTLVS